MKWSVGIEAQGNRVLSREEVVELADAVAAREGIASGVGSKRYGVTLVVEARSRAEAIAKATEEFTRARTRARLPDAPVTRIEAVAEHEAADGVEGW